RVAYAGERVVLTRKSRGVAALVSMEDLAALEKLEDEADIKAARKARKEKGGITLDEYRKKHKLYAGMRYQLIIKPSAEKALDRIPRATRQRVLAAMQGLCDEPRPAGVVKLAGEERMYRIRVSDYRILYDIYDDKLLALVLRVAHRKDA